MSEPRSENVHGQESVKGDVAQGVPAPSEPAPLHSPEAVVFACLLADAPAQWNEGDYADDFALVADRVVKWLRENGHLSHSGRDEHVTERLCESDGCERGYTFAIFAEGYPAAMYVACDAHIGALLRRDMTHAGSTNAWTVRPRQAAHIGSRGGPNES